MVLGGLGSKLGGLDVIGSGEPGMLPGGLGTKPPPLGDGIVVLGGLGSKLGGLDVIDSGEPGMLSGGLGTLSGVGVGKDPGGPPRVIVGGFCIGSDGPGMLLGGLGVGKNPGGPGIMMGGFC